MCGIAGIIKRDGHTVEASALTNMIGMLHHRGPDASGYHISGSAGLAHARLSIIDLAGGHQPMSNQDRTLWITFNGEIFNYVELREDLLKKGCRFQTQSDTEVLLRLYEERGEECVHSLNGQWAFAIWDSRREKLFVSRDRMGVRPLFYTSTPEMFAFASEIKSLFALPGVNRSIDVQALDELFTFWVTLPPRTMFEGVSELPPGHSLTLEQGSLSIKRYWTVDYSPVEQPLTEGEAKDRLLDLLLDATRIRLRSDVPVGAYLSGGLDSTVIAALVKQLGIGRLKTFSIAFEDKEFDESGFQNEASAFLQTDHQGVVCRSHDIGRIFPDVIWHTEKAVLRTAPAPLYLLSKLVKDQGFKVVLTGEGSDEVLGGYDIFKEAKIRRFWARYPDSHLRSLLLRRLYPYMKNMQSQSDAYLRAFFHVKKEDLGNQLFSHLPRFDTTSKLKIFFSKDTTERLKRNGSDAIKTLKDDLPSQYGRWDHFSQSQYLEAAYLLPGYILSSQGDRMAMAHSVEGRFPFLDYRVAELASHLPPRLKMKVLNEKYLLKQAVEGLVPRAIRTRHKQPYRAPDSQSFRVGGEESPLFDYVEELLAPHAVQDGGIFDAGAAGKLLAKARQGQIMSMKDNMAMVGVLSTQLVIDRFIKNFPRSA